MILTANKPQLFEQEDVLLQEEKLHSLIVWNDDINTFDWVIETLVDVCSHTYEQAEQCSIIIHYKGKCSVSKGEYDKVKLQCEAILQRGISATVD